MGQKQKTEIERKKERMLVITMAKLCMADASTHGQKSVVDNETAVCKINFTICSSKCPNCTSGESIKPIRQIQVINCTIS